MPSGSKSGLKTFFFLLIALIGTIVLGIGVYLMLFPNANIFGIAYASNVERIAISDVQNKNLNISNYTRVEIITQDANIEILCGSTYAESNFILDKNSFGFYKLGSKTDYTYTLYEIGTTLIFELFEPEYSFLKLTNNTKLIFNINSMETINANMEFDIVTINGGVKFGGATKIAESSLITVNNLTVSSTNGSIKINEKASIKNNLDLTTINGGIDISGDVISNNVNLNSVSGRITAKDFTNYQLELNIRSTNSPITIGNIKGNVYLDTDSGYFSASTIEGRLTGTSRIRTTYINVDKVYKEVEIGNADGFYVININEIRGEVILLTSGGNIKIDNLLGPTDIRTSNANVDVTVAKSNSQQIKIITQAGNVKVDFKNYLNNNMITTKSGNIDIRCSLDCSFKLNAQTDKGYIYRVWDDIRTTGEYITINIGQMPFYNMELISEFGSIIIDRYSD
ncbi:MAG: hypothetical protein PHX09_00175 [Clostridia bacterium]|nr:hypothetical protein [Clostridia bacterium]